MASSSTSVPLYLPPPKISTQLVLSRLPSSSVSGPVSTYKRSHVAAPPNSTYVVNGANPNTPHLHVLYISHYPVFLRHQPTHHQHPLYGSQKDWLPEVGFYPQEIGSYSILVRWIHNAAPGWNIGTRHQDHWVVALRYLPDLPA